MSAKKLTRRRFLATTVGVATAAVVGACAPKPPAGSTAEQKPAEAGQKATAEPAPKQPKEIRFLCRSDIKGAYAADSAVEEWNAQMESKITMDEPVGDVPTKVQAAQAAGDLVWDGFAVTEMPWSSLEWVKRGIIAPLDEYVNASEIPNADKVVPGIIPTIKEAVSYEGKQYGVPGNVGSDALAWFWDALKAAGYERQPTTWDEVLDASRGIKQAKPDLTPFASGCTPLCDLYAMLWGAREKPVDSDGLIDIRSEESIAALAWMRQMVEEELMPSTTTDQFGNWLKGGIGIITCYDVAGTMAQQTFGVDAADTGINFFHEEGKTGAGTPFWINCSVLFDKAKNPQGMVDFFLWWFGPDNKVTGKQITEVAAKPCYSYTYDEFVKGHKEYEWELKGIELVAKSVWFPANSYYYIQTETVTPFIERCLDVSQKFEPEATMEEAYKAIKDEIANQLGG